MDAQQTAEAPVIKAGHELGPRIAARKAMAFYLAMEAMGNTASQFVPWRPRPFVGAKDAIPLDVTPRPERPPKPPSPKHVAAVTASRETRRQKSIDKAQRALAHKRARQAKQSLRHAKRLAKSA